MPVVRSFVLLSDRLSLSTTLPNAFAGIGSFSKRARLALGLGVGTGQVALIPLQKDCLLFHPVHYQIKYLIQFWL